MSTPKGVISAAEAQVLNDNWTNLRESANRTAAGQLDNRSSWYSIKDLEDFLQLIKDDNENVDGVRFYLGVETTSKNAKGLTTIFMVPTEPSDGGHKDIPGARGMDRGEDGMPPGQDYPN